MPENTSIPGGQLPERAPAYLPGAARGEDPEVARRSVVAQLAARLTPRDRWLLRMLGEHPVLTSAQITALSFGRTRTANRRLKILAEQMRVVERFRPRVESGSAPEHYVLAPLGAVFLAAERGITVKQLGYQRQRAIGIAFSPRLSHTVGANEVFTALAAQGRSGPGRLTAWWSERTCLALWGDLARPDGYGRYSLGTKTLDFFLEYDTGSERLEQVTDKLPRYQRLAKATGIESPVLIYLHSASREQTLHRMLAADPPPVPVATTTALAAAEGGDGPAGPAWKIAGKAARHRLYLIELAAYATAPAPAPPAPQAATGAPGYTAGSWYPPPPPLPPELPAPDIEALAAELEDAERGEDEGL